MAGPELSESQKRRMQAMIEKGVAEDKARESVLKGEDADALEAQIADLNKSLETANARIEGLIAAVEKAGFKVDGDKVEKVEKSADEYIEIDGEKVLKSAVPAPLLKRLETQSSEIAELTKRAEQEDLRKRAKAEIPNLSGTDDAKGALLKAVDGIQDESIRKAVTASLKAADAVMSKHFVEVGNSAADDESSATFRLNKMAEDYAQKHNVSRETAFAEVTKSADGKKLLVESRNEQN